jgi:hypothetical protein
MMMVPPKGAGALAAPELAQRKYARTGNSLIAVTMKNFQKLALKIIHARLNIWLTRNSLCVVA